MFDYSDSLCSQTHDGLFSSSSSEPVTQVSISFSFSLQSHFTALMLVWGFRCAHRAPMLRNHVSKTNCLVLFSTVAIVWDGSQQLPYHGRCVMRVFPWHASNWLVVTTKLSDVAEAAYTRCFWFWVYITLLTHFCLNNVYVTLSRIGETSYLQCSRSLSAYTSQQVTGKKAHLSHVSLWCKYNTIYSLLPYYSSCYSSCNYEWCIINQYSHIWYVTHYCLLSQR